MTSYLNNGNDVLNYFAKFEKFLPHSIIMPSFTTVESQMPVYVHLEENDEASENDVHSCRDIYCTLTLRSCPQTGLTILMLSDI